jgi:hypothetical protein
MVTLSPRDFNKNPREAHAIPLPKEETTPPVTKINFVLSGIFLTN